MTPAATKVLRHLQGKGSITAVEAQAVYRIFDVAGRIMELRKFLRASNSPYEIVSVFKQDEAGKRYARYTWRVAVAVAPYRPLVAAIPRSHALVIAGPLRAGTA